MRKSLGYFLLISALSSTITFFIVLNFSFFVNENRIKSLLDESKAYDAVAFYIKNEIVQNTEYKLDEGTNFEDLNNVINNTNAKESVDEAISKLFLALREPTKANQVFPFRLYSDEAQGSRFSFEKYVNLQNNTFFNILSEQRKYLLGLAVTAFLLLSVGLITYSSKNHDRLYYLGLFGLATGVFLFLAMIGLRELSPFLDKVINNTNIFQEAKLLVVIKRVAALVINKQLIFYAIESVGFVLMGILILVARKMLTKETLQGIDKKI